MLWRRSPKVILAGDPCQLAPTILSQNKDALSDVTLLEESMKKHPANVVMLTTQYRMNQKISNWVSNASYQGKLVADSSAKNRLLSDLPSVKPTNKMAKKVVENPLNLIDTAGFDGLSEEKSDNSKVNKGEAKIVKKLVDLLDKSGVPKKNIAVIAPYAAQVEYLTKRLPQSVNCRTVDGYQGSEAEVVIISMVRSNPKGNIGFVKDKRRMNVAVSRAKRCCFIIGDSSTIELSKSGFLIDMLQYFKTNANLISPCEMGFGRIPSTKAPINCTQKSPKNKPVVREIVQATKGIFYF